MSDTSSSVPSVPSPDSRHIDPSRVLYEQDEHIVTITYNRPDRMNAIDLAMRNSLNAAWARFRDDPDAWVAIVTGTGRSFCSGADVKPGAGPAAGTFAGTFWEIPTANSFESGWEIFKPTIAAVNGPCLGYGVTAVSVCDFVIASERATFGFPEVRLGVPTIVGAVRMPFKVGWQHAMELLLIGEPVDAGRAKEMGLAWKVVPHDTLLDEARALAAKLCEAAPLAQRATKEVSWRAQQMAFTEAVRFGETMRRVAAQTEDAQEGWKAAGEKRRAVWKGR